MNNKNKAIFVTALCMGMLVLILVGLFLLEPVAFEILTGLLALWGLVELAQVFHFWLLSDAPEAAVEMKGRLMDETEVSGREPGVYAEPVDTATYDEILAEMKNEPAL